MCLCQQLESLLFKSAALNSAEPDADDRERKQTVIALAPVVPQAGAIKDEASAVLSKDDVRWGLRLLQSWLQKV